MEDKDGISRSLYLLGACAARSGDVDGAIARFTDSLTAAEKHDNLQHQEQALAALANVHRQRGAAADALAAMQRWVEILKRLGERADTLRVIGQIAEVHREQGHTGEAEATLRKLIDVTTRPEDIRERRRAKAALGLLLSRHGDLAEATDLLDQALAEHGNEEPAEQARLLEQVGTNRLKQGDVEAGQANYELALACLDRQDDPKLRAKILVGLGNAHSAGGNRDQAKDFLDRAAEVSERQGDLRATTIIRRATRDLSAR